MSWIKGNRRRKRFEEEVLAHLDSLYFAALKLTTHREDAEDLVQETYRKAFMHQDQLRETARCKPWLYRIMTNTWKNWAAKRSPERFPTDPEQWENPLNQSADGHLQSHETNPEADLMNRELWTVVESALSHLPPHYRMVIILSDIEGYSYKEIAGIMQWPVGTVMSSLSRARRRLARFLKRYKEGNGNHE